MYHPYFRGKQNELILLRDNAKFLTDSSIIPIIEPVKSNLAPLNKAVESLKEKDTQFILIVNPKHGDLKNDPSPIFENTIKNILEDYPKYCIGYIVDANSELSDVIDFLEANQEKSLAIIHGGFPKAKSLVELFKKFSNIKKHIFMDDQTGKLYRKQFKEEGIERVLIQDGFVKMRNRDYIEKPKEHFSDLHITYDDEGMDGFGDFLIAGNDYTESGGPAYAIAIHLTYLEEDEDMHVQHFVSDRVNTPTDPAGKFLEALKKLVSEVEDDETLIFKSKAYNKFKEFHDKAHFPGLGITKKLSMQHHIELISKFLEL